MVRCPSGCWFSKAGSQVFIGFVGIQLRSLLHAKTACLSPGPYAPSPPKHTEPRPVGYSTSELPQKRLRGLGE